MRPSANVGKAGLCPWRRPRPSVPGWDARDADPYRGARARRLVEGDRIGPEAGRGERLGEAPDLVGVAGLAFDLDHRVLGRQAGEDALVADLDDVDLML